MSRTIANIGSQRQPTAARFPEFVYWAIEAAESIKALSLRWNVPEESLRRYRDGLATPTWDRVCQIRFNPAERLALLRMIDGGQVKVEPIDPDELERRRQGSIVGVSEQELRGTGIALTAAAQQVTEVIHESLADGQIDPAEKERMEETLDQVQTTAGRLRPGFWGRLRGICRR